MKEFNLSNWHGKLFFTPEFYTALHSYVGDEKARQEHSKSINIYNDNGKNTSLYNYHNESVKNSIMNQLDRAMLDYSNMMIVTLSSYLEIIIQDFYEALFYSQPTKMYNFLSNPNNDKTKGYVDLKTILNAKDMDNLKTSMCIRAATNANKGTFSSIIKRLEKLTKHKLNKKNITELNSLVYRRNKIVHENCTFEIKKDIINTAVESIFGFLKELGIICKSNNIPFSDEGGLIS